MAQSQLASFHRCSVGRAICIPRVRQQGVVCRLAGRADRESRSTETGARGLNVSGRGPAVRGAGTYDGAMCRNITELRGLEPAVTREEIEAAARQYVRKVSGLTRPNPELARALDEAALEVAGITERL